MRRWTPQSPARRGPGPSLASRSHGYYARLRLRTTRVGRFEVVMKRPHVKVGHLTVTPWLEDAPPLVGSKLRPLVEKGHVLYGHLTTGLQRQRIGHGAGVALNKGRGS